MTTGDQTFRRLQSLARSTAAKQRTAAPTQELLTRHLLEPFLHRLTLTPHQGDFILKGGIAPDMTTLVDWVCRWWTARPWLLIPSR